MKLEGLKKAAIKGHRQREIAFILRPMKMCQPGRSLLPLVDE